MTGVVGHKPWVDFFERAIATGTLHHAYALVGPAHIGKTTLATFIAAELLQIKPTALQSHADVHWVERAVDEKTGKRKKEVSIEQIRGVVQFVQETSFYRGGYRIVVIADADHISRGAANALLKTLEEPTERTILFLLSDNENALLPTIRSRCQWIRLRPVPDVQLQNYLQEQKIIDETAAVMIRAAAGRPGLLVDWSHTPEVWTQYQQEITNWIAQRRQPLVVQWAAAESATAETDERDARAQCEHWLTLGFNALHWSLTAPNFLNNQQITQLAPALDRAVRGLNHNVSPRLLVEQVCLSLF